MVYTVHGILQARTLEWVVFPFCVRSSQARDLTQVSRIAGGFFKSWATREASVSYWDSSSVLATSKQPGYGQCLGTDLNICNPCLALISSFRACWLLDSSLLLKFFRFNLNFIHSPTASWKFWGYGSTWAISNPERSCCQSAALNMPANLENSAVATGLEKFSFHSNPKERQCKRMLKLPHNWTHLTC